MLLTLKIAYYSRRLFDEHGYHGAALRDVCKLAGCKMPTIYYHYESKEKLFDEVVRVAFEEMVACLWALLLEDVSYKERCIAMVIQKRNLSEEERIIYRLAMKTWLGKLCRDCCFKTMGKIYLPFNNLVNSAYYSHRRRNIR